MGLFYVTVEDILSLEARCKDICKKSLKGNLNPQPNRKRYFFRVYNAGKYTSINPSVPEFSRYVEYYCAKKVLELLKHFIISEETKAACINALDKTFSRFYSIFNNRTPKWALPRNAIIENWQNEKYEGNIYHPEGLIFKTDRGEMVRSKSEHMASNLLNKLGVPYKYEAPVYTKYGTKYPDFTLLNTITWEEKYVELLGIMGDIEYASNAAKKMREYSKSGIILGYNLLVIFETAFAPFDITEFENMIRKNLLQA